MLLRAYLLTDVGEADGGRNYYDFDRYSLTHSFNYIFMKQLVADTRPDPLLVCNHKSVWIQALKD